MVGCRERPYGVGMDARDPELTKDLAATLHARRDLGDEYESALIDSFLEKVDQRIDSKVERRVRRELAEHRTSAARADRHPNGRARSSHEHGPGFGSRYGFAGFSLIVAIPLSAIAATQADLPGLLVAWGGIVGVNVVQVLGLGRALARTEPSPRRAPEDPWDD
jgi:hypothetical protein